MRKLKSLDEVNASALPATVLVLLSKYAHTLRKHNGLILKLSSMNIFGNVHSTSLRAKHPDVHVVYQELLREVRIHLKKGTMYTNDHKKFKTERARQLARSKRKSRVDEELKAHRLANSDKQRQPNKPSNLIPMPARNVSLAGLQGQGKIIGRKEIEPQLSAFAD